MTIESTGEVHIVANNFNEVKDFCYKATGSTQVVTDNLGNLHINVVIVGNSLANIGFAAGQWHHWRLIGEPVKSMNADDDIAAIDPHPAAVEAVQNIGPIRDKFDE